MITVMQYRCQPMLWLWSFCNMQVYQSNISVWIIFQLYLNKLGKINKNTCDKWIIKGDECFNRDKWARAQRKLTNRKTICCKFFKRWQKETGIPVKANHSNVAALPRQKKKLKEVKELSQSHPSGSVMQEIFTSVKYVKPIPLSYHYRSNI